MSNIIPENTRAYCIVISNFSEHQLIAWLKLSQNKDLKLISQLAYNILYNKELNISSKQKRALKKHASIYLTLVHKKSSLDTKYATCNKNPSAILLLFKITKDLYG